MTTPQEARRLAVGAHLAGVKGTTTIRVLEMLLRMTKSEGAAVQLSQVWLSRELTISTRTVRRTIGALAAADLLAVVVTGGGPNRGVYVVNTDRLKTLTAGHELHPKRPPVPSPESAPAPGNPAGGPRTEPAAPRTICPPPPDNLSAPPRTICPGSTRARVCARSL